MLRKAQNQELSEEGDAAAAPEAGTSSDGEKKTGAKKWESGIKRGPANPIGIGKWSETAGTTPVRGHANPLSEISFTKGELLREFSNLRGFSPNIKDNLKNMGNVALNSAKSYGNQALKSTTNAYNQVAKSTTNAYNQTADFAKKSGDTLASWGNEIQNQAKIAMTAKKTNNIYKTDDGDNFFMNIGKGEFSEALLDARELMFSGPGIIIQWVIGVAGVEIGAPIALEIIDEAIIINDVYVWISNEHYDKSKLPPDNLSEWEKFKWQYNNNIDFQNVIVDIVILATVGVVRTAGEAWKYLARQFKTVKAISVWMKGFSGSIGKMIGYLPKKMSTFLRSKIGLFDKFILRIEAMSEKEGFKAVTVRALTKIPATTCKAYLTLLAFEYGTIGGKKILQGMGIMAPDAKEMIATGKASDENNAKIIQELPPASKKDLTTTFGADEVKKSENLVRENIKNDSTYYEEKLYLELYIERAVKCKRNEFTVVKGKKYDGNAVFIINKEYYGFNVQTEGVIKITDTSKIK